METRTIELASVIKDIAAGPFGSNLKVSCFVEKGFPIIDGANLKGIKVTDNVTKFVTEEKARSLHRSIASRGDVVVTISGNVGQIAYIPNNSQYAEYLVSQRQFRVTFDTEQVYVPYLVYYFHTYEGQHKILAFANQTGVPALAQPLKNFKKITVNLPTLNEQKRIASICEAITGKIETNDQINDNLQQQAQSLYQSWFVDYVPFEGIMPEAWYMGTLSDLADTIICGKTPSTKRSEYYGDEVPFITIPDMHNQIYAVSTERSLSTLGVSSQLGKTLPRNSTCVSCIGTAGLVCLVAEPSQTNQQINSIIPHPTASPYYIYLLAKTLSDTIQNLGSGGSTICNLNKGQFSAIEALIPSEKSMQEFDEIVSPLFEAIYINQVENLRLAELRDTLLPRLMSGEVDASSIRI